MAIKKSELYSSLWKSCDELRGGMDASQYKDYVLVLLFVKYVSDRFGGQKHGELVVPPGAGFEDLVALKGAKDIGEKINVITAALDEANELGGVLKLTDFNNEDKLGRGQAMVDRLSRLVAIFNNPALDFRSNRAHGDDLLGDAYEFLMRHFATESGKSKGQFYTPAEVSRILAKVVGVGRARHGKQTIYDPTCGSGSLLLKAHAEALAQTGLDLALYGQEIDNATVALAKMNMILHGVTTAELHQDNTLSHPKWHDDGRVKTFDFVVANPPFSNKAWTTGLNPDKDEYGRFALGVPPRKNGDFAFLLHVLASLRSTGSAAVILPHGVLFRGNAEAIIRRELLRRGYIKGIIGLPANLFYGTGIPACVVVLDKAEAASRDSVFLIDASAGFRKDGNKNRLRAQDIHRIVDVWERGETVPRYARWVPLTAIEAEDHNLNLSRYVDTSEPEDLHDLEGHLYGGIPVRDVDQLGEFWAVMPGVRDALFEAERPGYLRLRVEPEAIRETITEHSDFAAFQGQVMGLFELWRARNEPQLRGLKVGDDPKALIEALSEDLLATFRAAPLIDAYDIYQDLMDDWEASLQDEVYLVVEHGWVGAVDGEPNRELLPEKLIVEAFFADEAREIEALEAERDAAKTEWDELVEEHGGDEGLLADATTASGKVTAASVRGRLKALDDPEGEDAEEFGVLSQLAELGAAASAAGKAVRQRRGELARRAAERCVQLKPAEVQEAVLSKWLGRLEGIVDDKIRFAAGRVEGSATETAVRYAQSLERLSSIVTRAAEAVSEHVQALVHAR